jgi:hypothetical protein
MSPNRFQSLSDDEFGYDSIRNPDRRAPVAVRSILGATSSITTGGRVVGSAGIRIGAAAPKSAMPDLTKIPKGSSGHGSDLESMEDDDEDDEDEQMVMSDREKGKGVKFEATYKREKAAKGKGKGKAKATSISSFESFNDYEAGSNASEGGFLRMYCDEYAN